MRRTKPFEKKQIEVKKSYAGLGLFAKEPIKKGQYIEYFGPILTSEAAEKKGGKYLFEINSRWTIDGTTRNNIARYINHSCKPNCEAHGTGKRVFIIARRGIKPGEELGYDYGKDYYDEYIKPYGCRCGADKHRK